MEVCLAIGTSIYFNYLEPHMITAALGPGKLKCLPLFYAFTGCYKASFYGGKGSSVEYMKYMESLW